VKFLPGERPTFDTDRLLCQPVCRSHAEPMVELLNDAATGSFLFEQPPTLAYLERQYELLESGLSPNGSERWLTWILHLKATMAPIGFVQTTVRETDASIAYVLGSAYWRRGFAKEAVLGMLNLAFRTYEIEEAQAEMDVRNTPSIALAESLGFRRVALHRAVGVFHGEPVDEYEYRISKAAFAAQRRPSG
jgi:[ribosomal protein S5]-alanine N-acetyltransferase